MRLLIPLRPASDRSPTARGDGRGEESNVELFPSQFSLSIYSSLQISVPLPCRRFCFFTDLNRRRWEGGVGEKGKRAALCQPHVASSATQKMSRYPSSVLHSVLSAIVGGEKSRISGLNHFCGETLSGHEGDNGDPSTRARSLPVVTSGGSSLMQQLRDPRLHLPFLSPDQTSQRWQCDSLRLQSHEGSPPVSGDHRQQFFKNTIKASVVLSSAIPREREGGKNLHWLVSN